MVFLYPELHDPAHQIERKRFVRGELNRSFGKFKDGDFRFERFDSGGCGVKPNVFWIAGEIDQRSV